MDDTPKSLYQQKLAARQAALLTPGPPMTGSPPPTRPEDIPKEDLLNLTKKMSQRIKALDAQNHKLKEAHLRSQRFAEGVRAWVEGEVLAEAPNHTPTGPEGPIDLATQLEKWRNEHAGLERNRRHQLEEAKLVKEAATATSLEKQQREVRLAAAAEGQNNSSSNKSGNSVLVTTLQQEVSDLEGQVAEQRAAAQREVAAAGALRQEIQGLEAQVAQAKAALESSKNEAAAEKARASTAGAEAAAASNKVAAMEEQVVNLSTQLASASNSEQACDALQAQLKNAVEGRDRLKKALNDLRAKHKEEAARATEQEGHAAIAAQQLGEKDALLEKLQSEVVSLKRRVKANAAAVASAVALKEQCNELKAQVARESDLSEEMHRTKDELEGKTALVTRLRQESEAADNMHAMRTALIATRDAEIRSLKRDLDTATADKASLEEALAAAKAAYEASEQALKDATKSHAAAVEAQTKSAKASLAAAEASVVSERRRGEEELSKLREDHRKKSALARQLVAEKDEALTLVTAEADELRQEVESGGHNEKKIFALAQAQAARESEVKFSVRARENELLQLHTHLRKMEKEAAVTAETTATLKLEVEKLRRMSKRDGVNMEYLKNIVVQYLSLRDDTKKRTLARVLETLLQFNEEEKRRVDAAFDPWGLDVLWELASPAKTIAKKSDAPPLSPPPQPLPRPGQAEEATTVNNSREQGSRNAPRTPTRSRADPNASRAGVSHEKNTPARTMAETSREEVV